MIYRREVDAVNVVGTFRVGCKGQGPEYLRILEIHMLDLAQVRKIYPSGAAMVEMIIS